MNSRQIKAAKWHKTHLMDILSENFDIKLIDSILEDMINQENEERIKMNRIETIRATSLGMSYYKVYVDYEYIGYEWSEQEARLMAEEFIKMER